MPTVVVPFRGVEGKSRIARLPLKLRAALGEAMLADVLAACEAVGPCYVVTPAALSLDAVVVPDRGTGQGAAVRAGIDAALADGAAAPFLIVNADLPCVTARDVLALAGSVPDRGLSLAAAADGTTNALALSSAGLFAPVYGPGSAARFAALAPSRMVDAPNLVDDVDTVEELELLEQRLGPNTRRIFERVRLGAAA